MDKIVNAGIRITRKCNMNCPYCNIVSRETEDLSLDKWIEALDIIKSLGAKNLVLLGGEPTQYEKICELINYASKIGIECSLTTNGINNYDIVEKILDAGLNRIGISVDNLDFKDSLSPMKCKSGIELINMLLEKYKTKPIQIVNYTVVHKRNIHKIVDQVKHMNSLGVHTYLLPYHWGNEGSFEHRKNNDKNAFTTEQDYADFCSVMDQLIALRREGVKIVNSEEFIEASKKHIMKLDWKCDGLSELRVDSDGKMVCCCDNVGEVNNNFTIFDLKDENKLQEFFAMRNKDASKCKGCLWPSSYEAEYLKLKESK